MVCDDRNWLLPQGFDVTSFAYPYSNFGNGAATAVAECGYTNARAGWQLRPDAPATCVTNENCSETIPPVDAFAIRTTEPAGAATTLARPADDGEERPAERLGADPVPRHLPAVAGVRPAGHLADRLPASS